MYVYVQHFLHIFLGSLFSFHHVSPAAIPIPAGLNRESNADLLLQEMTSNLF